jgi:membrane protease YdiL (CAAX protease family)
MVPLAMLLIQHFQTRFPAAVVAAAVSSLLFATAHVDWFNPAGEPFHELTFLFRFVAAGVFATVFHYRGLGIAVGTHITYNVLTLLSN